MSIRLNPDKKKKKRKGKGLSKTASSVLSALLVVFMVGVITAGAVCITVLTDIGLIGVSKKDVSEEIAGTDYIDLDNYISNQQKTTIIYRYDKDGNLVEDTRLYGSENRIAANLDEISDYVKKAVVALEDKRFYEHSGVDWIRTAGSIVYDLMGKQLQGGSTITQQLIKNLTGEKQTTLIRKYREIKNALALERHFSKDEILEAYLNTIYLDMGCYGIKTGAEYYFNKDVGELTLMESAMLVSITQAPRKNNPIINPENNRERAELCLYYMLEQGKITQEEYDAALEEEVTLIGKLNNEKEEDDDTETEVSESDSETTYQTYYTDYIIDTVIEDFMTTYGDTKEQAWRRVYYGGLRIYSAVDESIQETLDDVYYNRTTFPNETDTEENPAIQSSMTVMDYEGRILGIAGGLGEKKGNRVLNRASSSPRQPGSSIKPLSCYTPAIELNYYYWSSYLPNYGITGVTDGVWPTNYGGNPGSVSDLRNLAQAIGPSLNTIPARIVATLTPARCYSFLRDRFHISTLTEADADYAPMAIGAMNYGVTTLEMSAAYATFGNGGYYYEPWCYYKVTDAEGTVLLEPNRTGEQVISSGTADVMNHLMQYVATSGTGASFQVSGFDMFCKSGTTSDYADKWLVGGTPYYVCAAWVGFDERKSINTSYYGSNPAGNVYKEVMNRIHSGLESKDFEWSGDAVRRTFCTASGQLASSNCTSCNSGWYKVDNLPGYCTICSGE